MPRVTVIIPNYNHGRFLRRRLRSVLDQSYPDFEVIYLDDASTDNSDEVFAEFRDDSRIRAIYNSSNTGSPFVQWNRGVREAKGEYIWIAEADDFASPELLTRLVPVLDEYTSAGLAYCGSFVVNEQDVVTESWLERTPEPQSPEWQSAFVTDGPTFAKQRMGRYNYIVNASAVVFRKKVFEAAGFADESFRLMGDWLMWHKMLALSDLAYVPDHLNYFRFHDRTVRSTFTDSERLSTEWFTIRCFRTSNALCSDAARPSLRRDLIVELLYSTMSRGARESALRAGEKIHPGFRLQYLRARMMMSLSMSLPRGLKKTIKRLMRSEPGI